LEVIKKNIKQKISKAPHDMQPKEILVIDITKSEDELLAGMKQKTRYNIRLAEKKNIKVISNQSSVIDKKYIDEFVKLVKITAKRDRITPHPESYYRKMFETIPGEIIKLYVAEYEGPASTREDATSTRGGKIIAANIMLFYGNTCTYMHGASSDEHRELMAPYLLQWRAIQDAKATGCEKYDFGGVNTAITNYQLPISKKIPNSKFQIQNSSNNSWQGITRFKTGFAPDTEPTKFPGSYDIVLNPAKYFIYLILQKIKGIIA
jgi:peptidoglycan pentaglycine glycine transferase (the first glycine)